MSVVVPPPNYGHYLRMPRAIFRFLAEQGDQVAIIVMLALLDRVAWSPGTRQTRTHGRALVTTTLAVGECVIGRRELAASVGATEQTVRSALQRLTEYGFLCLESTKLGARVTLVGFSGIASDQPTDHPSDQPTDHPSDQPLSRSSRSPRVARAPRESHTEAISPAPDLRALPDLADRDLQSSEPDLETAELAAFKRKVRENAEASSAADPRRKVNHDAWAYAAARHARLRADGIEPHAIAWTAIPTGAAASDLVARTRELMPEPHAAGAVQSALEVHRRRVDVAEAEARREQHLRWFTPSRIYAKDSFWRAAEMDPRQVASRAPARTEPQRGASGRWSAPDADALAAAHARDAERDPLA